MAAFPARTFTPHAFTTACAVSSACSTQNSTGFIKITRRELPRPLCSLSGSVRGGAFALRLTFFNSPYRFKQYPTIESTPERCWKCCQRLNHRTCDFIWTEPFCEVRVMSHFTYQRD